MPTVDEVTYLRQNRSSLTTYDGYPGFWFSGPIEYSESAEQIFLPLGGRFTYSGEASDRGTVGYYWTSAAASDKRAYYVLLYSDYILTSANSRIYGCSVRCVQDEASLVPVSLLQLDKTSVSLFAGMTYNLKVSIVPSFYSVAWESDAPDVAIVDQSGNVTALSEGTATISASAGGMSVKCAVTVASTSTSASDYIDEYGINHGPGVQIDDVVWAPVNCGYHATDYKYGKLYQWGRKYGQGYSEKLYVDGTSTGEISDATIPTLSTGGVSLTDGQHESNANVFYTSTSEFNYDWVYPQDGTLWNSGTESEPVKTEYDPCPSGWRVPTYTELDELRSNKSSWTTDSNGQEGYYFSGASAYTEQVPQVFFPAAGCRFDDGDSYYRGSCGNYWSSNSHSNYARLLYVDSANIYMSSYYSRANGYSVRCVQVTD